MDELSEFNELMQSTIGEGDFVKRQLKHVFSYYDKKGYPTEQMMEKIKKIILYSLLPLATVEERPPTKCFELFGFDILFDSNYNPNLIEVNLAPSLNVSTNTDKIIKSTLVNAVLDTINFPSLEEKENDHLQKIFPFNKTTEFASMKLANKMDIEESIDVIVEEIRKK